MKRLAAIIVALLSLTADAQWKNFGRGGGLTCPPGFIGGGLMACTPVYAFFEFAPASGAGMGAPCACAAVTGAKGETVTWTRSTAGECYSTDGQTLTQCAANLPRVSTGAVNASQLGVWVEQGITNLVESTSAGASRDLSLAAWVKTSVTCTKTATGMRNDTNGASTCTASGANGTVLMTLTTAAATRTTSMHLRRRTGTGAVSVTRDNGTTYVDVSGSLDATWHRVVPKETPGCAGGKCIAVASMTSGGANPVIGLKFGTSGDAVDVDFVQDEGLDHATTPMVANSGVRSAEYGRTDLGPNAPGGASISLAFTMVAALTSGAGSAGVVAPLATSPISFVDVTGAGVSFYSTTAGASYYFQVINDAASVNASTSAAANPGGLVRSWGSSTLGSLATSSIGGNSGIGGTNVGATLSASRYMTIGSDSTGARQPDTVISLVCDDSSPTRCR